MNFTNSIVFIVLSIVILAIIYMGQNNLGSLDNFDSNLSQSYQQVNYNTREQDCNQLTWSPSKCSIKTVIPSNKNVCDDELTPITNNQKECKKRKKEKNKNVKLQYDFDLLPSFNNSQINSGTQNNNGTQINNNNNDNNNKELETDIRSLNSLENDLISNY